MILIYNGGLKFYINHRSEAICINITSCTTKVHIYIEFNLYSKQIIHQIEPTKRISAKFLSGGLLIIADKTMFIGRKGAIEADFILQPNPKRDEILINSTKIKVGEGFDLTNNIKVKRIHTMHIDEKYFWDLIEGRKVIEGRLYDEKRRKICERDHIRMVSSNKLEAYFIVKGIRVYSSFKDLLMREGISNVLPGIQNLEEGIKVYRKFYRKEKEKLYGACALELEPI